MIVIAVSTVSLRISFNSKPRAMSKLGNHEHLISSMSLATCWITKLACLPSEGIDASVRRV